MTERLADEVEPDNLDDQHFQTPCLDRLLNTNTNLQECSPEVKDFLLRCLGRFLHDRTDDDDDNDSSVNLPKWTRMLVCGDSITPDQAFEILIRTDCNVQDANFEAGGNSARLRKELQEIFDQHGQVKDHLTLNFLTNDRIVSQDIGGPHGWCNWDGTIYTASYNLGKWPKVSDVLEDWEQIAEAFPYLNLTCQLLNDQKTTTVVEFIVCGGQVTLQKSPGPLITPPIEAPLNLGHIITGDPYGELGIPLESLKAGLAKLQR